MAGTTVVDDGLVEQAFGRALGDLGVPEEDPGRPAMLEYVRRTMGTSKIEVFTALFPGEGEAASANAAFERSFAALVDEGLARPLPGAEEAMAALRDSGVRVALTTGFAPATRDQLLQALGWAHQVDLVVSPADAGRGRPFPDMIWHAMAALGVDDPAQVAVAGDTRADMEAARNAGARVRAGVLTGTDDDAALLESGATHVLPTIAGLPALLAGTSSY
jgi:phosphonatase-like hydrolase